MKRAAIIAAAFLWTAIHAAAASCFTPDAKAAVVGDTAAEQSTPDQFDFSHLANKLASAVVAIQSEVSSSAQTNAEGALRETGGDRIGSGFIFDPAGYILTSAHVVVGAQLVTVRMADGRVCGAAIRGADLLIDAAVLKLDCTGHFPAISIKRRARAALGEPVMAIGNPYGLAGSVSVGIVSATQRYVPGRLIGFIQTDAVLNPGSSGGPLIDSRGHLIGINTAMYTFAGANTGIGFALPIEAVRREIPQLESKGRVAHGWIGADLHPIAADLALAMGLKSNSGALVTAVTQGSPAAIAGLQQGDVLVAFDGQRIDAAQQMALRVKTAPVGDDARLTVKRHGSLMVVRVRIRQDNDSARWLADRNDFPI
jgi:serine protease Do